MRDAQARADALLAEAIRLEADQAEREHVGAYLAAVEHGQGALAQTVTAWEHANDGTGAGHDRARRPT